MLTHLSLFSGIGGIDLAAEWAGFTTVGQVEMADYPTRVLEKHWPDVPRWRDIKTLTKDDFYERTGLHTVDLISGGFPCQPFSVAGNQKGKDDDRYLWSEMLRVVSELRPTWVLGENVPGILRIAGREVCESLEREGYAVTVFDFEVAAVGAPHRRERIFFVAHSGSGGLYEQGIFQEQSRRAETVCTGEAVAHSEGQRCETSKAVNRRFETGATSKGIICDTDRSGFLRNIRGQPRTQSEDGCAGVVESGLGGMADGAAHWLDEPDGVPRVAVGVKDRVDRLRCLGNAVVPQQVYPILSAIAVIEGGVRA